MQGWGHRGVLETQIAHHAHGRWRVVSGGERLGEQACKESGGGEGAVGIMRNSASTIMMHAQLSRARFGVNRVRKRAAVGDFEGGCGRDGENARELEDERL